MEVLGPKKETETSQQWEKEDVPITIPFWGYWLSTLQKKMKVVSVTFEEEKMEKELHI